MFIIIYFLSNYALIIIICKKRELYIYSDNKHMLSKLREMQLKHDEMKKKRGEKKKKRMGMESFNKEEGEKQVLILTIFLLFERVRKNRR